MNKYERKPEKIIDLHGHTTKEAKAVLERLADSAFAHVRIITGKGELRNGPVLRLYVEGWLRDRNITFTKAKLYDGGDGALEVFFKKVE